MFVKMKATVNGSPDGLTVREYVAGEVYDLPDRLASIFLGAGFAVVAFSAPSDPEPEEQPERKAKGRKPRQPAEAPLRVPAKRKAKR